MAEVAGFWSIPTGTRLLCALVDNRLLYEKIQYPVLVSESCNPILNKSLCPPPQIVKEFAEEISTLEDAIKRILRVHLRKVHIQELNFVGCLLPPSIFPLFRGACHVPF